MRYTFTVLLFLLLHTMASAQDGNWDVYQAQFEKGPASVFLNMDLIQVAPQKNLPFLVITGVTYTACRKDGLPQDEELHNLNEISAQVGRAISSVTKTEIAGTFTSQCKRLDYLYVQDTLQLRNKLTQLYTAQYQPYRYQISIRQDRGWEAYLGFLYPKEEVFETMANDKLLHPLRLAGDKLDKPRLVDHWLFFANSQDREQFMKYAASEKFKIEGTGYLKDAELPYQLQISRTDAVDPASINPITLALRRKAKALKGSYDGWETLVQKD